MLLAVLVPTDFRNRKIISSLYLRFNSALKVDVKSIKLRCTNIVWRELRVEFHLITSLVYVIFDQGATKLRQERLPNYFFSFP